MTKHERAAIYRHAAELIVSYQGYLDSLNSDDPHPLLAAACCDAILFACDDEVVELQQAFAGYFREADALVYWWADPAESDKDQEARRLALLFMAEIVESP